MKQQIRHVLNQYAPDFVEVEGPRAAVLMLLYERDGEPHAVFQKRSELVLHHKGQISLPGGAVDHTDPDLAFTALRETHEELGVQPADVEILGRLDELVTRVSNFRVSPFVGWLNAPRYQFRYPAVEVAYLLEVPISHLLDEGNFVEDRRELDGQFHVLPAYRFGDDLIWGATARIVTNFLDVWRAAAALTAPGA